MDWLSLTSLLAAAIADEGILLESDPYGSGNVTVC